MGTLVGLKTRVLRLGSASVARFARLRTPSAYRPGATVVTVNWNTRTYLDRMLSAVERMSPPGTSIVVVDNGSTDGSREFLASREGVRTRALPINVGHGQALDLAVPSIDTEYIAILDIDAFPVSETWLQASIVALESGAQVAGARLHRNFVHPSFLVTRTRMLHDLGLTFRPVGQLSLGKKAPLFLDVGEGLSQRVLIKFGGGSSLHFFEPTSTRGPGLAGSVFGGLVYHNLYSTQGIGRDAALEMFESAFAEYHPSSGQGDE